MTTTISVLLGLDDTPVRRMPRFERRMLSTKGIKLPSIGLLPDVEKPLGKKADISSNPLHNKLGLCIDSFGVQDEVNPVVRELDDILIGVVRAFESADSHKGSKINIGTLRNMLNKLPMLSLNAIMNNYGYGKSQASLYLKACKLVKQFYIRNKLKQLKEYVE